METELNAKTEVVSKELQSFFNQFKTEQQGKRYSPHPRFKKPEIWEGAAERCIAAEADPYSFIRAAFLYCTVPGGPFPHQLASTAGSRWYEEYRRLFGKTHDGKSVSDVFANEIETLIRSSLQKAITSGFHVKIKNFLLDDAFTRRDIIPEFVRMLLMPQDEDMFKKYGLVAAQQIWGNQKLLQLLQDAGYDLGFVHRARKL